MSFFKKLADFARKSNEKSTETYNNLYNTKIRKIDAENNAKVCANCAWYDSVYSYEYSYEHASHRCRKHDFCFSRDAEETKRIQYHRTCDDFLRR